MNITSVSSSLPTSQPQWITTFAWLGLTAKGIVYCLIGMMAFMAAFEIGGKTEQDTGKAGIFQFILNQPFGKILLVLITIGLFCYAIWRLIEAFLDTEHKGSQAKGIGSRIGYAGSGIFYGALAFFAGSMAIGNNNVQGSNDDSQQNLVQTLLEKPFGQWLVGALAVGIMALGIY